MEYIVFFAIIFFIGLPFFVFHGLRGRRNRKIRKQRAGRNVNRKRW